MTFWTCQDRLRFHVDTLIGISDGSRLPDPVSTPESTEDPDTSGINQTDNPCFPYKDGPGHKDATPQQLNVMHNMLKTAGISSFRPDFSKSVSSKENKTLWNICLKIFYKLVECGEYNGVAVGGKDDAFIKKSLDTYARSLAKRYVSVCTGPQLNFFLKVDLFIDTVCNLGTPYDWKTHKRKFDRVPDTTR